MDDFIEWLIIHGIEILAVVVASMGVLLLLSIDHDFKIMLLELRSTNKNLDKLTNSLMSSLNDVRKLIHKHRPHDRPHDRK